MNRFNLTSMNGSDCRVEVVRTRSALKALGSEWDVLARLHLLPMLSHAWVHSCAEILYREDDLHVVTARSGDVLVGAAPLVATKRAGIRHLEVIGSSFLYEPTGLLYESDASLNALAQAVAKLGMPVVLSRIPSDSPMIPEFRTEGGLVSVRRVAGSLGVPIESEWKEYLGHLSSRRRYDLNRARRRAEEAGEVLVRILCPRPDEVDDVFAEFVRIEASGWKDRNGSSLQRRPHLREFFLHYARLASLSSILRFALLDVNGQPIAAQMSVEYANRFWVLKIGYDEAWSRCSPGWQLLAETLRYAFDRKLKSYEFLGSDEPWLHGWNAERRDLSTLASYPATFSGMYGLAADSIARVRARVPSWTASTTRSL